MRNYWGNHLQKPKRWEGLIGEKPLKGQITIEQAIKQVKKEKLNFKTLNLKEKV